MTGLTRQEVQERIERGQVNTSDHPNTRTYGQIVRDNVLTFFNFLNIVLLIFVLAVRSYKNAFFVLIAIYNTVIGIVQEIHAKKIIDQLAILTQAKAVVLRDGKKWSVPTEKLVLDDVIFLKAGNQIPADSRILEGSLEVNESLLTGEADNLPKQEGDELFSGSFVTSGQAMCQVIRVGSDNYASQITREAKEFRRHNSELRNSLNAILKVISIIIVPLGSLLFFKQYYMAGDSFRDAVVSTVAAVLGMIPEGLILLTSVALTIGAVNLAMKKTLIQELYCIETLARVDTLCLDKTGTLTEGTMQVEEIIPYSYRTDLEMLYGEEESGSYALRTLERDENELDLTDIEHIMGNLMEAMTDSNATADALHHRFPARRDMEAEYVIPFSSDRKYSGVSFKGQGSFLMGAVQFLFPRGMEALKERCAQYASRGFRVITLAYTPVEVKNNDLPGQLRPIGLLLLSDVIREEAPETLRYFMEQGVDLKVISGDDPATVAAIAKKAGLQNADSFVDASRITSEEDLKRAVARYNVFGRVTPQQKKAMVLALKEQHHTVAMTGDGVNDVLALKEADCSIAMAEGSDAAKNIANVVLLNSSFASLPNIVNQGRRVVNNIRTAASMFLIKTMFSVMLSLVTILVGEAYPFEPIQMSLISICAVGIPTFLLAQENNYNRIDHTFLRHVFMNAFPAAVTITGCVFTIMMVCRYVFGSTEMLNTACVLVTGWNYMSALKTVYAPLNRFRKTVIYTMQVIFFLAAVIVQDLLVLKSLEFGMIILVFILMTFSPIVIEVITEWIRRVYARSLDQAGEGKWYYRIFAFLTRS